MTSRRPGPALLSTAVIAIMMLSNFDAGAQVSQVCTGRPSPIVPFPDGWQSIAAPTFTAGSPNIEAYAVAPFQPDRLFVTNGTVIMASHDGGCSFETVFDVTNSGDPVRSFARITALETSPSQGSGHLLYALVHSVGVLPQVWSSHDSGENWEPASEGLSPVGYPIELVISESSPNILYLFLATHSQHLLVYRSDDSGATWTPTSDPVAFIGQADDGLGFSDFAVDPLDPDELWAGSDGLWHSSDRGATWRKVHAVTGRIGVVATSATADGPSRILAFSAADSKFHRSDDGGRSWAAGRLRWYAPGSWGTFEAESVVQGPFGIAAASRGTEGRVYRQMQPGDGWEPLTSLRISRPQMRSLSMDRMAAPSIYAHSSGALWRSHPSAPDQLPPPWAGRLARPAPCPIDQQPDNGDRLGPTPPPQLHPPHVQLTLSPGQSAEVPYELSLVGAQPIDVFFLIDASHSMRSALCGVANGAAEISRQLTEAGVDAWFGVATYQDFPARGICYPYREWVELAPLTGELYVPDGTCGGSEPQMNSLVHLATGESPMDIPGEGRAGFRGDALPVVVHISDEPLVRGFRHLTIERAIETLNERGIRQVGMFPGRTIAGQTYEEAPAAGWLRKIAQGTGAVATETGLDCDGDGFQDIPSGGALVCPYDARSQVAPLAEAVAGMVLTLTNQAAIQLVETSDTKLISHVDPRSHDIDLTRDNTLRFRVTYTCPANHVDTVSQVTLGATMRGAIVSDASARVECIGPSVSAGGVPRAPFIPPAQPPLPPTNPNVQPHPNARPAAQGQPQPHPQSQTTGQSQAAAVAQRQEQPQLALVHSARTLKEQLSAQNAMTRVVQTRSDPLAMAKFGLAMSALSMVLLYGLANATVRRAFVRR